MQWYPLSSSFFEETDPEFTDAQVKEAMRVMDDGYLAQDYYKQDNLKLPLPEGREDSFTFDDHSWTEYICRKLQWEPSATGRRQQLRLCGLDIGTDTTLP